MGVSSLYSQPGHGDFSVALQNVEELSNQSGCSCSRNSTGKTNRCSCHQAHNTCQTVCGCLMSRCLNDRLY
ncbi:hypothetical protein Pyn_00231 [Prunus yedoensis var. nudiflora]|uniref:Uncharacterized protein n=1 Tax=Prunus yedoensis var. nudiflora TaxID=2094558 RepID=A0A314Y8L8_PRUYE|nr:hypothetical protein Pyn_00231 [Prunus yedoensis var. nudiflora]